MAEADIGDDMFAAAVDVGKIEAAGGMLPGERGVDLGLRNAGIALSEVGGDEIGFAFAQYRDINVADFQWSRIHIGCPFRW